MSYNPDYVPSGPNNRSNPYYKTENHVRIAKIDSNKREFFGTIGGIPGGPGGTPNWASNFAQGLYYANGEFYTFDEMFTFTRASNASQFLADGTLKVVGPDVPRFEAGGLLIEDASTNLLHTTDTLVTQSHTVTAVPHTLHFSGTGTVTLSGASTDGPLVGTGSGDSDRVSLTFTPTAGTLTLTVSGAVNNAQLEALPFATSYIPNLAASGTITRAKDSLTAQSGPLGTAYHTGGAWLIEFKADRQYPSPLTNSVIFSGSNVLYSNTAPANFTQMISGDGSTTIGITGNVLSGDAFKSYAVAWENSSTRYISMEGAATTGVTDANGFGTATVQIFVRGYYGHINRIQYWDTPLDEATLNELTAL